MEEEDPRADPEHRVPPQLLFHGVQQQLIEETAAADDHKDRAQRLYIRMLRGKTLYKEKIGRHQQRVDDHKDGDHSSEDKMLQSAPENKGIKDKAGGTENNIQLRIRLQ